MFQGLHYICSLMQGGGESPASLVAQASRIYELVPNIFQQNHLRFFLYI